MKLAFFHPINNLERQSQYTAPVGLGYIVSVLKQNLSSFFKNEEIWIDIDIDRIISKKPDIVAISSYTTTFTKSIKAATLIKKELNVPVFLGSYHITALPHKLPECVDVGVLGEGELVFSKLIDLYLKDKLIPFELSKINGISYHDNGKVVITGGANFIENLDDLPLPCREILYSKWLPWKYNPVIPSSIGIFTSRGCPFKCDFCMNSKIKRKIRYHSPEKILEELFYIIKKYPYTSSISILDELFILDKNRLIKIVELIRRKGLHERLMFGCHASPRVFDEDICKLLKSMNVRLIAFGFESGAPRVLKYLKGDKVSINHNKRALELCYKYNINVTGYFMIGTPIETYKEFAQTYWFIRRNLKWISIPSIHNTVPLPGTKLWDEVISKGMIKEDIPDWGITNYSKFINDYSIFLNQNYSKQEFAYAYLWFNQFDIHGTLSPIVELILNEINYYRELAYLYLNKTLESSNNKILIITRFETQRFEKFLSEKNYILKILKPEHVTDCLGEIGQYDIIFLDHSLCQFRNSEQIISKLLKNLNSKGKLIILEFNSSCINNIILLLSINSSPSILNESVNSILTKECSFFSWRFPVIEQLHFFKLSEIQLLFNKQNLKTIDIKPFKIKENKSIYKTVLNKINKFTLTPDLDVYSYLYICEVI